jgi:hypothetical protein
MIATLFKTQVPGVTEEGSGEKSAAANWGDKDNYNRGYDAQGRRTGRNDDGKTEVI